MSEPNPRDLLGYGRTPPHAQWPGGARIAVSFVINYEEGAENSVLLGDVAAEHTMSEMVDAVPLPGQRNLNLESHYEYGSRAGFWRLWRLFSQRRIPVTVWAVGLALAASPDAAAAMVESGWEVASHGWRWYDYRYVGEAVEREHMRLAIEAIERLAGKKPVGWYSGRLSPNTHRLVAENPLFLYSSDSYADDLPYWNTRHQRPLLMIPYSFDNNDQRFLATQGFNSGEQFYTYLKDGFDLLYAEGDERPRMMSIGLHCRVVGRPGRAQALARFMDYVLSHDRVWLCRREEIARHWPAPHPALQ
jgi:putative urate catabolism protein